VFRNALSALRGIIKLRQLVLLGKSVSLRAKYNMQLEKGVTIGDYSTLDALSLNGLRIGASSSIGSFSIIKVSGTLTSIGNKIDIGQNVGIGDFAHIGGAGGVVIGNDTIAGGYLSIHPENHVFADKQRLIREQGVTRKGITIGSNCWIGAKVTVLDGSQVGNGCVIAAGAVVNGIFPDNVVIGGVPAKILKEI
jgi:acetyltransferase-like isoleucine patch superfamily enzyme